MNRALLYLQPLDIFGLKLGLNYRGFSNSKSAVGFAMTLFFFIIFILVLVSVGNDSVPRMTFSRMHIENPERLVLNENTFAIAFGLAKPNTYKQYIDPTIFSVEAKHVRMTRQRDSSGTVNLSFKETILDVEICNLGHFGSVAEKFRSLEISKFYCLKQVQSNLEALSIQGTFESDIFDFISLNINRCTNGVSSVVCASDDDIDTALMDNYLMV